MPADSYTPQRISRPVNKLRFAWGSTRQIEGFGRPGDIATAIPTGSNSPCVLHGVATANRLDLVTIGLTGRSGGRLRCIVKECNCVPSDETPHIQECHTLIGHIFSQIVEQELFG